MLRRTCAWSVSPPTASVFFPWSRPLSPTSSLWIGCPPWTQSPATHAVPWAPLRPQGAHPDHLLDLDDYLAWRRCGPGPASCSRTRRRPSPGRYSRRGSRLVAGAVGHAPAAEAVVRPRSPPPASAVPRPSVPAPRIQSPSMLYPIGAGAGDRHAGRTRHDNTEIAQHLVLTSQRSSHSPILQSWSCVTGPAHCAGLRERLVRVGG